MIQYKTNGTQSRYLERIAQELAIVGSAVQDAAKGVHRLKALSTDEQEQMAKMAGKLAAYANLLDDIAEMVAEAEARNIPADAR